MKHELIIRATSVGAIMTGSTRVGLTKNQENELSELVNKKLYTEKQEEKIKELVFLRDNHPFTLPNGKESKPITEKQLEELEKLESKELHTPSQLERIKELIEKRDSKPKLSETAKSEVQKYVLFNKYGIENEFSSKPTDKGIMNEPESIKIASVVFGWFDIPEKKTRIMNNWITGEPDVLKPGIMVADVKSSFSGLTFPFFEFDKIPNQSYFWQMQSYMWLCDLDESELVYVLTDTPEQMILDMIQKKIWKMNSDPQFSDHSMSEIEEMADDHVRSQHNFSHIPMEKRVRQFILKRDNDAIEQIKIQMDLCRSYYDEIYSKI